MSNRLLHLGARWGCVLGAVFAMGLSSAIASAPTSSLTPQMRPAHLGRHSFPDPQTVVDGARLQGQVGYVVRDGATGQVLEDFNGGLALAPASVAKALTGGIRAIRAGRGAQVSHANHRDRTRRRRDCSGGSGAGGGRRSDAGHR